MNQNLSQNGQPKRSPNVHLSITCRDKPDFHVYMQAMAACVHANSKGVNTSFGYASSKYAVHVARNQAVGSMPDNATHLLFVDNDISVQEDAIELLLQVPCDIAAGCYVQMNKRGKLWPHIAVMKDSEWLRERWDGVLEGVDCAGTGCMLIRREVFEALEFPWFQWPLSLAGGEVRQISDDVDFCNRAKDAGFTIGAHGNVFCGHEKTIDSAVMISEGWVCPETLDQQLSKRGQHVS